MIHEIVPVVNGLYADAIKPVKKEEGLLSSQIKAYRTFVTPRTTAGPLQLLTNAYQAWSCKRIVVQ